MQNRRGLFSRSVPLAAVVALLLCIGTAHAEQGPVDETERWVPSFSLRSGVTASILSGGIDSFVVPRPFPGQDPADRGHEACPAVLLRELEDLLEVRDPVPVLADHDHPVDETGVGLKNLFRLFRQPGHNRLSLRRGAAEQCSPFSHLS